MIKHADTGGNIMNKMMLPVPVYRNRGILTSLISRASLSGSVVNDLLCAQYRTDF